MAPQKKSSPAAKRSLRRSSCPIACVLDMLGDRWSLLILRDLFLGHSRFSEFIGSPEGIPTNILTERLRRLQRHGLIKTRIIRVGSSRVAYHLTKKGESLGPTLTTLRDWSLRWVKGTRVGREKI